MSILLIKPNYSAITCLRKENFHFMKYDVTSEQKSKWSYTHAYEVHHMQYFVVIFLMKQTRSNLHALTTLSYLFSSPCLSRIGRKRKCTLHLSKVRRSSYTSAHFLKLIYFRITSFPLIPVITYLFLTECGETIGQK